MTGRREEKNVNGHCSSEEWHKANFNGVAKGNLGEVGCGEVIRNIYGFGIMEVTFPLGHQTNHFAKACVALHTTKLTQDIGVRCLWLEWDSNNIIKYLKGDHSPSWSIVNMMEETRQIFLTFKKVYVSHECREVNFVAK